MSTWKPETETGRFTPWKDKKVGVVLMFLMIWRVSGDLETKAAVVLPLNLQRSNCVKTSSEGWSRL